MLHKTRQCQIEASNRYNKKYTVLKQLRLNKKYDSDIIDYLDAHESKNAFIKEAIRAMMSKES